MIHSIRLAGCKLSGPLTKIDSIFLMTFVDGHVKLLCYQWLYFLHRVGEVNIKRERFLLIAK